jgi:beta-ribofuranosylaminobenzene 5'-phosphate synthase
MRCQVPSRIAISLIDMNGNLGRCDGGVGFSINRPTLRFTLHKATHLTLADRGHFSEELHMAVMSGLTKLAEQYDLGGANIVIEESIPEHSGFGSKTATLLSVGKMYSALYHQEISFEELALLFGRGGTSGIGVNILDKGGFIVDGGHATKRKATFTPSSATFPQTLPPLLARYPMPAFPVLIVIPPLKKIFGETERQFFADICPIPEKDVQILSRTILMQLLPAVVEQDLSSFAHAINMIQQLTWKRSEIDMYGPDVRAVMQYGLDSGALAVGMSSIGPGIYFVGGDLQEVYTRLVPKFQLRAETEIFFTPLNNRGIQSEVLV